MKVKITITPISNYAMDYDVTFEDGSTKYFSTLNKLAIFIVDNNYTYRIQKRGKSFIMGDYAHAKKRLVQIMRDYRIIKARCS